MRLLDKHQFKYEKDLSLKQSVTDLLFSAVLIQWKLVDMTNSGHFNININVNYYYK